jgi:hypothetical protein
VFVPSNAFGMSWEIVYVVLFGNQKVLHPVQKFWFCTGALKKSEIFTKYWRMNCPRFPNFSEFLEIHKYFF